MSVERGSYIFCERSEMEEDFIDFRKILKISKNYIDVRKELEELSKYIKKLVILYDVPTDAIRQTTDFILKP